MSSENPFTAAESGVERGSKQVDQAPEQGRGQSADPERVAELQEEVEQLRERIEEEEMPEPDFECPNRSCEGFAVEEIQPEHVTTHKSMVGSNTVPKVLYCPRCGEEVVCSELVPKDEQKNLFGQSPVVSNEKSAGRALRDKFEEYDRVEVLEEADCEW